MIIPKDMSHCIQIWKNVYIQSHFTHYTEAIQMSKLSKHETMDIWGKYQTLCALPSAQMQWTEQVFVALLKKD